MSNAALAKVKAKYQASLAKKADEIESLAGRLSLESNGQELVAALHQLAGSAGFYGEIELSEMAHNLEHRVLERGKSDSDLDAALAMLVSRLRR